MGTNFKRGCISSMSGQETVVGQALLNYTKFVGLAAMIVAAGVMILLASRDAFDVDDRLKEIRDPTGSIRTTWEWKYMSDFAQDARSELLHLVRYLRLVVTSLLVLSLVLFVLGFCFDQIGDTEYAESGGSPMRTCSFCEGKGSVY